MITAACFAMLSVGVGSSLACQSRDGMVEGADIERVKTCRAGILLGWMFILCGPVVSFSIQGL